MSKVRFGIIGTGSIAQRFFAGLAHVPNATVAAVYSRGGAKARQFAAVHHIPTVCDEIDDLLASDIDAVYIATPHPSHATFSIAALQAGKAVLCEKPAATSLDELDAVIATAQTTGRLYMEAMKPPFFPLYRLIRERIDAGAIGEVRFVRAGFANPNVAEGHAVLDPAQAGGGLLDIGIYSAFLAVDWLGAAGEIQTLGRIGASGVDTFASLNIQHERGISQLYSGLDIAGSGEALLGGSAGYIVIHDKWWNPAKATLVNALGEREELMMTPQGSGLNYETAHFCDLLRQGRLESPIMSHAKTRAALAMTLSARDTLLGIAQ
ncbi:Gfo/Idh/MocA family oxidoreductase [Chitinibacter fontanus]|uniref:Gfo/Idh/MocA family oxidoreductase n=1 Tax=Chitinibacter fontanus TaxID=1737446 RepID=A0A7D5V8T4_9NEIS|nr:Gfo/Idh/MocA family oxidoreductase [Chitinibacter fontanus]QLI81137.1 Gfo/Idh/MocA family oxidoreductase [Chitinibacter fontanus]